MSTIPALLAALDKPAPILTQLYGDATRARPLIQALASRFMREFPSSKEVFLFSTPGRTEVGGNHTDHNAGRVLAGAVDLDVLALVSPVDEDIITVYSEGYPKVVVFTNQLEIVPDERYTSSALIRGVCSRLAELGYRIGGFNACLTSGVPKGSGLSSSAAYEVMIGTILNHLYNEARIDPVTIAVVSQYAENNYFGKPSGLMDQTTCAVGGFVTIDFEDATHPLVHKLDYDFVNSGYGLVIVETGGDHADLTEDYAALAGEMKAVARELGGSVLRQVSLEKLMAALPELHKKVNDRAILRAFHYFADNERVLKEVAALESGRFDDFLKLVIESGRSSWMLNQNCYSPRNPTEQGITLALTVSEKLLGERGAWRVHGGGFAGTIQAFVPLDQVDGYLARMKEIFGPNSCYLVSIRRHGSIRIDL